MIRFCNDISLDKMLDNPIECTPSMTVPDS